jgi:ubiquinone/menaquinone biosynthesis C-methylase UbiE
MVLDAGCGAGVTLQRIAERGHRVVGMDISRAMLDEVSGLREVELRPMVHVVQGDVECLPFAESSFSAAVCLGVVTYLTSAERAVSELARVLEPEGTLILSVVNKAHLMHYLDVPEFLKLRLRNALGVNIPGSRPTVRSYSVPEIMRSLRHHGFRVEDYAAIPLGLAKVSGRAIPPVQLNARIAGIVARTRSIPLIGSLGGMCMFRARNGLGGGSDCE